MTIQDVLLIGLAAWRVTSMLAWEEGPFGAFFHLRRLIGITHGETGEPFAWPTWWPASAFSCPWCLSILVVLGIGSLWILWPYGRYFIWAMAASAVAALVETGVNRIR